MKVKQTVFSGRPRLAMFIAGLLQFASLQAACQVSPELCGPLNKAPWDYRKDKQFYKIVEDNHFTPQVESLMRGQSGSLVAPDIDYTLTVFPNHHRALLAATRLAERDQSQLRNQLPRPIECYYERALRFRADDVVVRMLYAQFLYKRNRGPEALSHLDEVIRRADDNPLTLKNVGLVLLEMKEYDRAILMVKRLEELQSGDTQLRDALISAKKLPAVSQEAAPATPASAGQGISAKP